MDSITKYGMINSILDKLMKRTEMDKEQSRDLIYDIWSTTNKDDLTRNMSSCFFWLRDVSIAIEEEFDMEVEREREKELDRYMGISDESIHDSNLARRIIRAMRSIEDASVDEINLTILDIYELLRGDTVIELSCISNTIHSLSENLYDHVVQYITDENPSISYDEFISYNDDDLGSEDEI